jgi:hypothetical protein
MSDITNKEKLACVVRELGYRQRVYARLVEKGKMSEPQRQQELRLMSAIVDDYRALAADDNSDIPLFLNTVGRP